MSTVFPSAEDNIFCIADERNIVIYIARAEFNLDTDHSPAWVGLSSLLLRDKSEPKSAPGLSLPVPPERVFRFG